MANDIIKRKVNFSEFAVKGESCLDWIDKDMGLSARVNWGGFSPADWEISGNFLTRDINRPSTYGQYALYSSVNKISNDKNKRVVGLILDTNSDGSYKIAILGNETLRNCRCCNNAISAILTTDVELDGNHATGNPVIYPEYNPSISTQGYISVKEFSENSGEYEPISIDDSMAYVPTFTAYEHKFSYGAFQHTEYQGIMNDSGVQIPSEFTLTNDKTNTLVVGIPYTDNKRYWIPTDYVGESPFHMLAGDFYDYLFNVYSFWVSHCMSFTWAIPDTTYKEWFDPAPIPDAEQAFDGHSLQTMLYNVILTKNESQALNYLNTGELPNDAFLFPLDWENIPAETPEHDDDNPAGGGDDEGESSPSGISGTPTTDATPTITPSMISNNNLYWLTAGQLESFIRWFWNEAGDLIDLQDLWQRITGLYTDMGACILNIRFFPVDKSWIGGTIADSGINLGMLRHPQNDIERLARQMPTRRTIGTIHIDSYYNSFCDNSPYTTLSLYLPFHGWLDLDIDIFNGNDLRVKAIYDHMAGTIQYSIYVVSGGFEYEVNTCISKMSVDIPITLQSKYDRDSAIFNNVTSAFGNLMGAVASTASHSPIGLVMSISNATSGGAQSAPLKVLGTQGETGSYFVMNKCAIYIKRPTYNRPSNYGARVGFPSNTQCNLGKNKKGNSYATAKGFTTVYNPYIHFSGNKLSSGQTMKPTKAEIDEIYNYLEKGVIL